MVSLIGRCPQPADPLPLRRDHGCYSPGWKPTRWSGMVATHRGSASVDPHTRTVEILQHGGCKGLPCDRNANLEYGLPIAELEREVVSVRRCSLLLQAPASE